MFEQVEAISILNGKFVKIVDWIRYIGSNILSLESYANVRITKASTAIANGNLISLIK